MFFLSFPIRLTVSEKQADFLWAKESMYSNQTKPANQNLQTVYVSSVPWQEATLEDSEAKLFFFKQDDKKLLTAGQK